MKPADSADFEASRRQPLEYAGRVVLLSDVPNILDVFLAVRPDGILKLCCEIEVDEILVGFQKFGSASDLVHPLCGDSVHFPVVRFV